MSVINYKKLFNAWLNIKGISKKDLFILKKMRENDIIEAFLKHLDFGTGGLRAKMGLGSNLLNIYTVSRVTLGIANYLKTISKSKVALGFDTRNNSVLFANTVTNILLREGITVYRFKSFVPTPVLSFSVQHLKLDLGIMITASHNPPEYNGYKIYDKNGCQLVPHQAISIKNEIDKLPDFVPPSKDKFNPIFIDEIKTEYFKMIHDLQNPITTIQKPLKIAFTSLHGTGFEYAKEIIEWKHQFIEVPLECKPDGDFSHVASSNPEDDRSYDGLKKLFIKKPFDIGFATDPDADRLGVLVNHRGSLVPLTGNQVGALLTKYLISQSEMSNSFIASTIVSSDLAKEIARAHKVEVIETLTGFKYIGEQIELNKSKKFIFGYEESFGFLLNTSVRDKDAFQPIPVLLDYVSELKAKGRTLLDELDLIYEKFGYYQEELITFTFEGIKGQKKIIETINTLSNTKVGTFHGLTIIEIENYQSLKKYSKKKTEKLFLEKSDVIKFRFNEGGWVVFRPSGTEPKLKIYLSLKGRSKEDVNNRFINFKEKLLKSL